MPSPSGNGKLRFKYACYDYVSVEKTKTKHKTESVMTFNSQHNRSPSTRLLLLLALAFSCLAGYAHSASEKTTLNIAYYEHPPFSYTDAQGKARGLWIEKTGKIIEKAGFSWKAHAYPVKRIGQMLGSGKTDLFLGLCAI